MEELNKRLKKNKIFTIISAVILLGFIALTAIGFVSGEFLLGVVGFLGFCAFLGVTYGFIYYKKLIKRSYCPYCGTHYNYGTDISWEEVQRSAKQMSKQEKVIATVEFSCQCTNCGETQDFSADFVIYEHNYESGKEKVYNIHDLAKKYFV